MGYHVFDRRYQFRIPVTGYADKNFIIHDVLYYLRFKIIMADAGISYCPDEISYFI